MQLDTSSSEKHANKPEWVTKSDHARSTAPAVGAACGVHTCSSGSPLSTAPCARGGLPAVALHGIPDGCTDTGARHGHGCTDTSARTRVHGRAGGSAGQQAIPAVCRERGGRGSQLARGTQSDRTRCLPLSGEAPVLKRARSEVLQRWMIRK